MVRLALPCLDAEVSRLHTLQDSTPVCAGVSDEAVNNADLVIKVPMQPSFVDSYNVSVR